MTTPDAPPVTRTEATGRGSEEAVLPERAVEALARFTHDRNNDHGWYDPECLNYPDDHREPYHRLYARAGLAAVLASGFDLVPCSVRMGLDTEDTNDD